MNRGTFRPDRVLLNVKASRVPSSFLLALTLATVASAYFARAQDTERRLEQYSCVLRLPDPDFTWLGEEDIPGATLACRDSRDRFVILIVAKAPPGYYIDARQGAAFEKGMSRKSDGIELLSGKLTEFLGVTCYEIRGRLKADQSLTLTRMFAANGFLYNLQAMIPSPPAGEIGRFDDLFATFQFTDRPAVPGIGGAPGAGVSPDAPVVEAAANLPRAAVPKIDRPKVANASSGVAYKIGILVGAALLALIFSFVLLRSLGGGKGH